LRFSVQGFSFEIGSWELAMKWTFCYETKRLLTCRGLIVFFSRNEMLAIERTMNRLTLCHAFILSDPRETISSDNNPIMISSLGGISTSYLDFIWFVVNQDH
jgi:hypothetical protein